MGIGVLLAIALGGALGALARHSLSSTIYELTGPGFPWGIFAVNILGGLMMGLIVELSALKLSLTPETRAFLTTGVLGGFTTFSTFSLDSALLIQRGAYASAAGYMIGSVTLSVLALFGGLWLIRGLYGP
jgi:CrcB protein